MRPQTQGVRVADTNMFVSKSPHGPNTTLHLPNATPNASRWNMGIVGFPHVAAHIGHVHFRLFGSISFPVSSGIWALAFTVYTTFTAIKGLSFIISALHYLYRYNDYEIADIILCPFPVTAPLCAPPAGVRSRCGDVDAYLCYQTPPWSAFLWL